MCTSIAFPARGLYGRNLDLEYHFGEEVVITPRRHPFSFHFEEGLTEHFALVGMATVARDTPLYAEALNEKGLYMAGLYFPGNARYFEQPAPGALNLAPYELIPWILGRCASVSQARQQLENLRLVARPFGPEYPLAPLHWQLAGPDGSLILEPMEGGLRIYEDEIGVLTNNPPYPFQRMNLNSYRALSPRTPANTFAPGLELEVYGQGLGGLGLPGDASPLSRFVRAAFLCRHGEFPDRRPGQVAQFFQLLGGVAMVRGSVRTAEDRCDETIYSCCCDGRQPAYYWRTYEGSAIHGVRLGPEAAQGEALLRFAAGRQPEFLWEN